LEAWQAGERIPAILEDTFESGLREPPWICLVPRPDAGPEDVSFWIQRRGFQSGKSKDGKAIYGDRFEEEKIYELH